jgi:hypothetical protein
MDMIDMNCKDCEERFSDYLEQALGADDRTRLERHLIHCTSCSELLSGMTQIIEAGAHFPVQAPPPWLGARIVANTPRIRRETFRSLVAACWKSLGEPRTALAIFTTAVVMAWLGGGASREAVFDRAEGALNCAYDHAVRTYYRSPVVIEIHSRLGRLLENS